MERVRVLSRPLARTLPVLLLALLLLAGCIVVPARPVVVGPYPHWQHHPHGHPHWRGW